MRQPLILGYRYEKIIDFIKNNKKIVISAVAVVLVITIAVSVISFFNSGRSPIIPREGARIIIDCGVRVGFMVEPSGYELAVTETFACKKKHESTLKI